MFGAVCAGESNRTDDLQQRAEDFTVEKRRGRCRCSNGLSKLRVSVPVKPRFWYHIGLIPQRYAEILQVHFRRFSVTLLWSPENDTTAKKADESHDLVCREQYSRAGPAGMLVISSYQRKIRRPDRAQE